MPHPVLDAAETFKAAARRREAAALTRLHSAYTQVYSELTGEIRALEEIWAASGTLTRGQVTRLAALDVLLDETRYQVNRFAQSADEMIVELVHSEALRGFRDSELLTQAAFQPEWLREQGLAFSQNIQAQIQASWVRVPFESVETLTGMLESASPLRTALVNRLGNESANLMRERMIAGITAGRNPRKIAREVMGETETWAMTTVRTAQLNAYRYATQANYQANRDVVSGWRWMATFDSRTCAGCLAMHGTEHGVDESLNDHHNGRCTQIPIVPLAARLGIPEPEIGDAEDWLRRRTVSQQQEQLGKGIWEEWNAGRVPLRSLTTTYEDPVYGTMRRAPTLEQVRNHLL